MTGISTFGDRPKHRKGRWPGEDRDRNWSDVVINRGISRIADNHKLEEATKDSFLRVFRQIMALLAPGFWTSIL